LLISAIDKSVLSKELVRYNLWLKTIKKIWHYH
jgi:hypothetical protein